MKTQRGSLSALTVCIVLAAVALAGLVFDGGVAINEYQRLSDLAENAARAGAQEVIGARSGDVRIDSRAASETSRMYLQRFGLFGVIRVSANSVSVELSKDSRMQILGLLGLHHRHIRIVRTVNLVSG